MNRPGWYRLLYRWPKEGLTLPFLIGALAYHEGRGVPTLDDAARLLADIAEHPVDGTSYVEAQWCHDGLEMPVLCLRSKYLRCPTAGLGYTTDLMRRWDTTDPGLLRQRLLASAEESIRTGRFSFDPGLRNPHAREFDDEDKNFIDGALG